MKKFYIPISLLMLYFLYYTVSKLVEGGLDGNHNMVFSIVMEFGILYFCLLGLMKPYHHKSVIATSLISFVIVAYGSYTIFIQNDGISCISDNKSVYMLTFLMIFTLIYSTVRQIFTSINAIRAGEDYEPEKWYVPYVPREDDFSEEDINAENNSSSEDTTEETH